jgi:hypothetical protein
MKKIVTLLACLLTGSMLRAQAVPMALEDWKTTQGTQNFFYKNITKTDPSGNVFVAGATMNNGFPDILVAKYNAAGSLQWIQQFAGTAPNGVDAAAGLYVNSTDVYITGTISNNSVTPETDCFTMKLSNSAGSILWSTTYSGAAGSYDAGKDITMDGSGNLYVTGASYNSSFNADYLVLKYNSSGTQQWVNTWDYTGADDGGYKIAISGTNVNVSGAVTTTTPGAYKMSTIKLTQSTGSITAANTSTAVTTSSVEAVTDMALDGSGNVIIVGSRYSSGQHDFYVQKLNAATLASVFVYTWDGGSSLDDFAKAVTTDGSGNVFVAGFSMSSTLGRELTLIKLNGSGTQQWTQTSGFNGDDEAADLITDANNDVYVTGYKSNGTKDYYTAKYSGSGTKVWEIEADGNSGLDDHVTNVALDALDNVVVTGQSKTGSGDYEFMTVKYAQKDVTRPTDFDGERPAPNFMYYRNRGQIIAADTVTTPVPEVKFYTNNTYPAFYFGNSKQSFVFARMDTASVSPSDTLHRIDLDFTSSNESAETYPLDEQQDGYLNYFLAHTGSNGIANVKGNERLITSNLYNNIDLMCSSNQNGIKYYFIVKPGGNIRDIQMEFTGASSFNLNGTTNELTINSSIGNMTLDKPIVYQLTSGNVIVPVSGWTPDWQTNGASNKYKFNDGVYTNSLTLIIEVDQGNSAVTSVTTAPNIEWSTYYGSPNTDGVSMLNYDASNNLYAAGGAQSSGLPNFVGANVFQANNNGSYDGYLAKFNSQGVLLWRTYVGGSADDGINGFDIAANGTGDLYCVGNTQSTNLLYKPKAGTTLNHNAHSPGTDTDGYIFQLNPNGNNYNWLTYYGGDGQDRFTACKFDGFGNFFIVGHSASTNLNVVGSASQYTSNYIDLNSDYDAYIMKLNKNTFNIDWATYVGSTSTGPGFCSPDYYNDLDFNSQNDVFVGGYSKGDNYPIVYSAGSSTLTSTGTCFGDAIITRFNNTGQIVWSTYFGGQNSDGINAIKVDGTNLYVAGGTTGTTTYPTVFSGNLYANTTKSVTPTSAFQTSGFLVHFDDMNFMQHSTLIGGDDGDDRIFDIETDASGNIYLIGSTTSSSLPLPSGGNPANTWTENNKGLNDLFIFALQPNNPDVLWSTQIGGNQQDLGGCATIDGNNKLFISGSCYSPVSFPWNDGGGYPIHFQGNITGPSNDVDGSITRLKLSNINYLGIDERKNKESNLLVYPNPTKDQITISCPDFDEPKIFTIFNMVGQQVMCGNINGRSTVLSTTGLSEGMYVIEVKGKTNKLVSKFVKQ